MNAVQDEARLVTEACQGSLEAFELLVTHYEPRIRRMLYGFTRDVQLTQDLCQETFLAAYKSLSRLDGEQLHFAAWLYRIALNQVRSEWRRRKHVTVLSFSSSFDDDTGQRGDIREEELVSQEFFEDRVAERDLVRRVLAQLPETSVMCLLLDAEGFTYHEIADILHDSLPSVRSRLSRARQTFQRIYTGYTGLTREGRT